MTTVVCTSCGAKNFFLDDVLDGFKCKSCGQQNDEDYEYVDDEESE